MMILIINYPKTNHTCYNKTLPRFLNLRLEMSQSPFTYRINYTFSKVLLNCSHSPKTGSVISPFHLQLNYGGIPNG